MLRVFISKSPNGAVNYFDVALDEQDSNYYLSEKITAYFEGKTAKLLGLEGELTRDKFPALAHGINPITGGNLTTRRAPNARAGYDYTWSSVKSASIVYAITKDPAILEGHINAVKLAKAEVEAAMQTKTRVDGKTVYQTTGNMISSDFVHFTTRPIEDKNGLQISDPQLHTHSFIYNCTWNETRQRFQAVEEGNLRRVANYFEAIYHAHFSKSLVDAGYDIVRTRERWEIKNISRQLIEKFSNRTLLIDELARQKGLTGKAKAELGARTRLKKDQSVQESELDALWKERLTEYELEAIQTAKNIQGKGQSEKITAKEAIDRALDHYCERISAFPEKRLLGHALSLGYGRLTPEEVKAELKSRNNIVSTHRNTIKYITTKEMVKAEREMIFFASSTKGTKTALNPNYEIKNDILNAQQRSAVKHLLNGKDQVSVLLGSSGVGKTSLLTEVQVGIIEKDKKIFAAAPSTEASKVLREKGFEGADTISSFLINKELQEKMEGSTLLIDEAGMVGVQTMNDIFQVAQKNNIRLVLSGDPSQHQSILAGDSLKWIVERSEIQAAQVDEIVRQSKNEPYRRAIQDLAKGDTLKGFNRLEQLGAVKEIEDRDERHEQLTNGYLASVKQGRSSLIVSPTHQEAQEITQTLRAKRKELAQIKGPEKEFVTQQPLSFTEEEKRDKAQYEAGMVVRFHQNTKGFTAGQKYEVQEKTDTGDVQLKALENDEIKNLDFDHHKSFNVYQQTKIALAEGDLLRINNNGKTLEGTRLNNGQRLVVQGFDDQNNIHLSNGKTLDQHSGNFTHGYVSTSYGSQGSDCQDLFVAQSSVSLPASNERQFYVSSSRGKEKIAIYTDNISDLKEAIARNSDRMSAQEVANEHSARQRMTQSRRYHDQLRKEQFTYERPISKELGDKHPEPGRDVV